MWADAHHDGRPAEYRWHCLRKFRNSMFLVPRHKVWLMPAAGVPCSNAANIGECKTWTQSEFCTWQNSITGAKAAKNVLYSVPAQKTAKHRAKFGCPPVSDVAAVTKPRRKTRWNLLGWPQLWNGSQTLVSRCLPYCEDMCRTYCCLTSFFRIVDTIPVHALFAKI